MLEKAISRFSKLASVRSTRDDDLIDQLNHYVVVGTLLSLAVLVGAKAFVGSPINCWVPKEYDKDHFQYYVDNYCWISQLYNVPFTEELPYAVEDRMAEERDVSFYRWVMVMFMFQAMLFEVPHLIWQTCKTFSGINMEKIIGMTVETQLQSEKERGVRLNNIAYFIDRWLSTYRRYEQNPISRIKNALASVVFCFGRRSGCYLSRLYLFTKALYFTNIVVQFVILSAFLGFNYWTYGGQVIQMLSQDSKWRDLEHFPRIGMCDFEIRQLQNIQRYTVQCVLSINLFLEKIYAVMWFALVFLALLTLGSLIMWTVEELFTSRRERFLKQHLYLLEEGGDTIDKRLFKKFVRSYLRDDGIFLLRVVGKNSGHILTFDLLRHLWQNFKRNHHKSDDEYTPEHKPLVNSSSV